MAFSCLQDSDPPNFSRIRVHSTEETAQSCNFSLHDCNPIRVRSWEFCGKKPALLPPGTVRSTRDGTVHQEAGPVHQGAGQVQVYVSYCTWTGGWSWRSGTAPARVGTPGSRAGTSICELLYLDRRMVMEKWHCSRQCRYTRKPGRYKYM